MKLKNASMMSVALLLITLGHLSNNKAARPVAVSQPPLASSGAAGDSSTPGTVAGVVRLDGPAPLLKPITMTKDPVCMKTHPGGATNEEVGTGPDGTLANVI